jgi:hypothetical protein
MGNALSAPSVAPHADHRGWIIAFGVIEILIGLFCLLLAAFVSLFFLRAANTGQIPGQASTAGVAFGGGLYLLFAAFFFAGASGSFRCKNWARLLMLVGSGAWMVFGLIGMVVIFLVMPKAMATRASMPPSGEHLVMGIALGIEGVFGVLLPLVFLIFYSRNSVKATFLARSAVPTAEAPPLPHPPLA